MLIEKEKIQEAKEKLSDNNAYAIAEILNLEKFDEKNLKSVCCFHEENTASFIYNPKSHSFHCFGCNKNIDIIDAYMHKGLTYIQAVQKLFELAGIDYAFGEHLIKTKREYKYPREETNTDRKKVEKYLKTRKLSVETLNHLDIREDNQGNIVFNYYDLNDVLTMVKYRPARKVNKGENKCWCQKNADTTPLLFNMNRINISEPLIITEGELDCASLVECGFTNSVSVPLGAGNTHWINECWDWLQQFNEIIICADNDEAGQKLQKDIIYRLGSWRTKFVDIPKEMNGHKTKDVNEVLFWGGKEMVSHLILNAVETPVNSVVNYSDIQDVDLDELDGMKFGIDELDKALMKIPFGSFNIVTGVNGTGKSSFLSQIICNALDQDLNVWLYSKELPNYMSKNWLNYPLAGRRNVVEYNRNNTVYYKVNPEAKKKMDAFYDKRIHIYKDEFDNDIDSIIQSMEDSIRKFGDKMLIVDNLTAVDLGGSEETKYSKQTEFIKKLISIAKKYNVVVFLVIHPHKMDIVRRMNIMDIQGSMAMTDLAHRCFSLYRVSKQDKEGVKNTRGGWVKEPIPYDVCIDVLKDRFTGRNGFSVGMYYDRPTRRFYSNEAEFSRQYKWDTNVYEDKLEYPVKMPY